MLVLPFRDHSYVRITSCRTGETLLELKMLRGSLIVWGAPTTGRRSFDALLAGDGQSVSLVGMLRDRLGAVLVFGECLDVRASHSVEVGDLAADYDPSWMRDST